MHRELKPLHDQPLRRTTIVALCLSLIAVWLWVALAPMESAVLVQGHIRAMEDSKPIQHLRGGKIASINAQSGVQVARGDILLQLDITEEQSALKANLGDYLMTLLDMEVAQTHLNKLEQLEFSEKVLLLANRLQRTQLLDMRQQNFAETIERQNQQLALLDNRQQQLQLTIQAQKIENKARLGRLTLLQKQFNSIETLAEKTMSQKSSLMKYPNS